jgi:hypothetical protein
LTQKKSNKKREKVSQSVDIIMMSITPRNSDRILGLAAGAEWGVVHKAARGECGTLSATGWDAAVRLCTRAFIDERISLLG